LPVRQPHLFLVGLLASGCTLQGPKDDWVDQLSADGPCWRVDLTDGLDEESTAELHDLYACLDKNGGLAPLAGVDAAWDSPDREGTASGIVLARILGDLPDLGLDPFGMLGTVVELMERRAELLDPILELSIELMYGQTYEQVSTLVDLTDGAELDRGLVRPALPLLGPVANALLDLDLAPIDQLASALGGESVRDLLCTALSVADSDDSELVDLRGALAVAMGQAIEQAQDTSNDRWAGASGHSLRDLAQALLLPDELTGETGIEALMPAVEPILADADLRERIIDVLADAEDGGHLDPLPIQLAHLSSVDVDGGERTPGEDSALGSLLRLLAAGNTSVVCTIDLGLTEIDIELGNLSVSLLSLLATLDPDTVESGVSLLGELFGWNLTQDTLDWVAGSGVCPTLTEELVDDLGAVDRLTDPEVGDLLAVLLELLSAFHDESASDDRIPELVDAMAALSETGLVDPIEEVLLDLGDSALMDGLTDALPLLLNTSDWSDETCPSDSEILDLSAILELAADAASDDDALFTELEPLTSPVLEHAATWQLLDNLGDLLQQDGTRLAEVGRLSIAFVELDPELEALDTVVELLGEAELMRLAMLLLTSEDLLDAMGEATPGDEGPLPFAARLVVGGTLDVLLRTLDLALDTLGGLGDDAAETAN